MNQGLNDPRIGIVFVAFCGTLPSAPVLPFFAKPYNVFPFGFSPIRKHSVVNQLYLRSPVGRFVPRLLSGELLT